MEYPSKRQRLWRLVAAIVGGDSPRDIGPGSDPPAIDDGKEDIQSVETSRASPAELKRRAPHDTDDAPKEGRGGIRHRHQHRRLHHRHAQVDQVVDVVTADAPTVTSVIRIQVVVDNAGNTLTEVVMPGVPTPPPVPPFPSLTIPTVPSVPAFPTLVIPTVPAFPFPASSESQVPVSIQGITSSPTRSPPVPTNLSSGYSLSSYGNSTTGIPCNTTAFSNTTTLAIVASYATTTTLTSSTSLSESSSSSTEATSMTTPGNGVIGGAGTPTGGRSTATAAAGAGSGIQKPAVIGGVVGGLAGLALILIMALLLIRWKKHHDRNRELQGGALPGHSRSASGPSTAAMTERSSTVPLAGSAGFLKRFRPLSQQTAASDTTAPSERGFYKVSGRKIPTVLGGSGGDGYGGGYEKETLGSSYRDGSGPYSASSAPGSPRGTTAAGLVRSEKEFEAGGIGVAESSGEKAFMRPSPARTPVSSQDPLEGPSGTPPVRPPRPFRDGLGRSHPSEDGSKASKFMEDV